MPLWQALEEFTYCAWITLVIQVLHKRQPTIAGRGVDEVKRVLALIEECGNLFENRFQRHIDGPVSAARRPGDKDLRSLTIVRRSGTLDRVTDPRDAPLLWLHYTLVGCVCC